MKNIKSFVSLLVAILIIAGCALSQTSVPPAPTTAPIAKEKQQARSESWEQAWKEVVDAAKKEGSVTVYSTIGTEARKEIEQGMREQFGITVEFVVGRGPEVAQKAITEKRAGIHLVDAFIAGATTLIYSLKPAIILTPVEPFLILPEVKDHKMWTGGQIPFIEKDRMGVGMPASFDTYVAFNTDLIKEGEITSYYDLLNPKYKGKIAMFDPVRDGTGQAAVGHMAYVLGSEGKKFLQDLAKQEPIISINYRQLTEWLARGKYPIAIGSRIEETIEFKRLGSPITLARVKEGGKIGSAGGTLALVEQPAHRNAMVAFANWIMSKEGQIRFQRGFGNPSARVDVPKEEGYPYVAMAGEKFYFENEENIELKKQTGAFCKDVFGHLMK